MSRTPVVRGPYRIVSAGTSPRLPVLSPDDPAEAAARRILRRQLAKLDQEEGVTRKGEIEGVHQLRVTTRRLRATLRLFQSVLPRAGASRAHQELAWLGKAIGEVRDLDVLKLAVLKQSRRLEPTLCRALAPMHRSIAEQRASAHARLIAILDSARYRHLRGRLSTLADSKRQSRRGPTLGRIAVALVAPLWRSTVRSGRGLAGDASDAECHRLRVRVKRLRYALDSLGAIGGKRVRRALKQLERLQDALGANQDAVTQTAWLRAYATGTRGGTAVVLAAGALMQVLARRARRSRRRASNVWADFHRPRLQQKALSEFVHPQLRAGSPPSVRVAS